MRSKRTAGAGASRCGAGALALAVAAAARVRSAAVAVGAGGDEQTPPRAATPADAGAGARPQAPARRSTELTLEQQVGRMVILRFAGHRRRPATCGEALREGRAAGVILFRDNVADPAQLRRLTRTPARAPRRRALIVCVDQEGGEVRIAAVGAARAAPRPSSRRAGTVREPTPRPPAATCAPPASTVTLAPVADVPSVDGAALADRAFSSDPDAATAAVAESIARLARGRRRHHGQALPRPRRRDRQHRRRAGHDRAHARRARRRPRAVPRRDRRRDRVRDGRPRDLPGARRPAHRLAVAGRSSTGCCASELGFEGVVMTDSLEAAAVQAVGDVEEAAVASAERGRRRDPHHRPRLLHPRLPRPARRGARRTAAFRERVRASAARVLAAQSSRDG